MQGKLVRFLKSRLPDYPYPARNLIPECLDMLALKNFNSSFAVNINWAFLLFKPLIKGFCQKGLVAREEAKMLELNQTS